MTDINHNLEVAKPQFLYFIENMSVELAKWIQYTGCKFEGSRIIFCFKSSQNSLKFKIYGGVKTPNLDGKLLGKYLEIYQYFKELKYNHIY